jgi:NADH dehydrogenase (ubiquinone) Fe-S protein 3
MLWFENKISWDETLKEDTEKKVLLNRKLLKKVSWVNKQFLTFLKKIITFIKTVLISKNALIVKVTRTRLVSLLEFLHSHILSQYSSLVDIIVYDNPTVSYRFTVIYNLLSTTFNARLSVAVYTTQSLEVPSVCSIYPSAGWLEREAWDLYGVFFINHPDLRKILTDYGFNHHPLRKDFPLSGYKEISYSEKEKRILHSSLEITQAYRTFSFNNKWL